MAKTRIADAMQPEVLTLPLQILAKCQVSQPSWAANEQGLRCAGLQEGLVQSNVKHCQTAHFQKSRTEYKASERNKAMELCPPLLDIR